MSAEMGGLTKAAQALGLTQSGMSHIISSLEADFGFPLLVRNRSGAKLTEAGEKVLPLIKAIIEKNRVLENLVQKIRSESSDVIRVAAFTSVAVNWLPGIIKEFQQEYPNVEFKLLNGDYLDIEQWLADGSVDAAFVTMPGPAGFQCVPLCRDKLMVVMPEGHPLVKQEAVKAADVALYPFISLLEGSDQDYRRALEKAGVSPRVKFTTKDDYAILAMVEKGLGITIMPELLLRGRSARVVIREILPAASRTIALATSPLDPDSAAARFVSHTAQWVEKNVND